MHVGPLTTLALVAPLLPALGCGASVFACAQPSDCGIDGVCEASGYCSFPDDTCASMQRYGEHAPGGIAGQCVEPFEGTSTQAVADSSSSTVEGSESITIATLEGTVDSGMVESSTGTSPGTTGPIDDSGTSTGSGPSTIGPLIVEDDPDDGAMYPGIEGVVPMWLPSGEEPPGLAFLGEYPAFEQYYGHMRFRLPEALPAGTVVESAYLELDGHTAYNWDGHALRIWAEDAGDAPPVTGVDAYPGSALGVVLNEPSVRWPDDDVALAWNIAGPNVTPDLAPLLQQLIDEHDGLAENTYVQFWIGEDELDGEGNEVGWLDSSAGDETAPRLTLTIR